jgi:hypothetical protein
MRRGLLKKLGLAASTAFLATAMNAQNIPVVPSIPRKVTEDLLYLGNERFGVKPVIALYNDWGYDGRPVQKLLNVPEEIRHVPIHPDDTYAKEKNNGPIEPKDIKGVTLWGLINPVLVGGLEFKIDRIYLNAAVSVSSPLISNRYSDYYERNYTNHPGTSERGYGAALTQYSTSITPLKIPILIIPKLSAEITIPVYSIEKGSLEKEGIIIGYGRRRYNFSIETGWDRFDKYERNEWFPIEEIIENSVYIGYGSLDDSDSHEKITARLSGNTRIGVDFYNYKRLDSFKDMQVKARGWTPFIMQSVGIQF